MFSALSSLVSSLSYFLRFLPLRRFIAVFVGKVRRFYAMLSAYILFIIEFYVLLIAAVSCLLS